MAWKKNLIYFSFLWNISYFLIFLWSFSIPFTDDSISFQKLLFDFLLLLIINLCHTFSRLLMTAVWGVCGHIKASWDNLTVCLVLVPGYQPVWSVRPGHLTYGILQTSADYIVQEDLPWPGKDCPKRKLFGRTCPMTALHEMGSPPCMAVLRGVGPVLVASSQMGIASIV